MKKVIKEELVELLKAKTCTYQELSKLTGYHPKSLIRINSMLKSGRYNTNTKNNILIEDYLKSDYKTYRSFYNANRNKYNMCYSNICRILNSITINKEILIIKKYRNKQDNHFDVIDYKTRERLFRFNSLKNDTKSIKSILFQVFKDYGLPDNVCFINFSINKDITTLLYKYHIKIVKPKQNISYVLKHANLYQSVVYRKSSLNNLDFYNITKRKTIKDNIIQFKNTRYKVLSNSFIPKGATVKVYYNDIDLFVMYNDEMHKLTTIKELTSKKGLTKY